MNGLKDLLLEILFIVLPIFIYQIFWVDNPREVRKNKAFGTKLIVTVLTGISMVLCMTFPIHILPGYILDLRVVPFIIGIFYGGYQVGIVLTATLLLYRFYLGGPGFYATTVVVVCVFIVFTFLIRFFRRASKRQKIGYAGAFSTVTAILVTFVCLIISLLNGDTTIIEKEIISKFTFYILLHPIASCLAVYLIESLREKRFMQMEMERMEKMKVLGELATSVAHEIRNPMTVTRGFLQILKVPADQQQYLDLAVKEVDHVETIIEDYLHVTRPTVDTAETLQVGEVINQTIHIIKPYATVQNVEIRVADIENGIIVEAPKDKFSHLLISLIKNGIESLTDGGIVYINATKKNGYVVIRIIDNGNGMTKEEIKMLGLPFYSIKENGTGLDLMFCYRFVEMLNGNIKVKSRLGEGTEFIVMIPSA